MAGKYGTEQIKKIVLLGAEALNVLSKVVHKQGIFVAFQLSDELSAIAGLDVEALKQEVSELDPADRADILAALKAKLVLLNPAVEAKIEGGADLLNEMVDYVAHGIQLVEKGKALLGA